jgi:hypothetical protein
VTRTDTATLKATTAIVSAVALFAAGDSFTHVYDLARQHNRGLHLHRPLGPREAMKGTGMYEQPKWAIPSAPTEQVPHGTMAPPAR